MCGHKEIAIMKGIAIKYFSVGLMLAMSLTSAFAATSVASKPYNLFLQQQHHQLGVQNDKAQQVPQSVPPLVNATIFTGSLRSNIMRIAKQLGWPQVVWGVREDYQWVGTTKISGDDAMNIFAQLLKEYPVQAIFYKGNHVLVLIPRTLQ